MDPLNRVEYIRTSGVGLLNRSVSGRDDSLVWKGTEDPDWTVEDIANAENIEEDRLQFYSDGEYLICEISAISEEQNDGPVQYWVE